MLGSSCWLTFRAISSCTRKLSDRFPSKEAALGLYHDAAYQEAKRIRQASTSNVSMVLVEEYT